MSQKDSERIASSNPPPAEVKKRSAKVMRAKSNARSIKFAFAWLSGTRRFSISWEQRDSIKAKRKKIAFLSSIRYAVGTFWFFGKKKEEVSGDGGE